MTILRRPPTADRNRRYLLCLSAEELAMLAGEAQYCTELRRLPTLAEYCDEFRAFAGVVDDPAFSAPVPPDGRVPALNAQRSTVNAQPSPSWPPAPLSHVLGVGVGVES